MNTLIKPAITAPLLPVLLLCAIALSGCNEYIDRRENVSISAGDSVARNKAIHIIDPWPTRSFDARLPANGARMQRAIETYRAGGVSRGGAQAAPANMAPAQTSGAVR